MRCSITYVNEISSTLSRVDLRLLLVNIYLALFSFDVQRQLVGSTWPAAKLIMFAIAKTVVSLPESRYRLHKQLYPREQLFLSIHCVTKTQHKMTRGALVSSEVATRVS
jgi:hypothetical protein